MSVPGEELLPFRWDLVAPAQLGSLLNGVEAPNLWFLADLVQCAGKAIARSGNGDLVFVGRSLDSMFDLLGGALADTTASSRTRRLPLSFARPYGRSRLGTWRKRPLTFAERAQAQEAMAAVGVTPHALGRRDRPITFIDVVHGGSTFTELFGLLRGWVDDEHGQWDVIRRKVRFVGVTIRSKTSPNTHRWQQHADWPRQLPAKAVVNVSLNYPVWSYFGDRQVKLTRSYRPDRWLAESTGPGRDEATRHALAEAVAIVAHGRSTAGRRRLAQTMSGEPPLAQPWLRSLIGQLNNSAGSDARDLS